MKKSMKKDTNLPVSRQKLQLTNNTAVFIDWANVYGWKKALKCEPDPKKIFKYLKKYKEVKALKTFGVDGARLMGQGTPSTGRAISGLGRANVIIPNYRKYSKLLLPFKKYMRFTNDLRNKLEMK